LLTLAKSYSGLLGYFDIRCAEQSEAPPCVGTYHIVMLRNLVNRLYASNRFQGNLGFLGPL